MSIRQPLASLVVVFVLSEVAESANGIAGAAVSSRIDGAARMRALIVTSWLAAESTPSSTERFRTDQVSGRVRVYDCGRDADFGEEEGDRAEKQPRGGHRDRPRARD